MLDWIDTGHLAGLSATLAYFFIVGTVGMGLLTWRQRGRFAHWWDLSARDRADAVLNVAWLGILLNAAFQRITETYSFAAQEWRLTAVTVATAPLYLGLTLTCMAGFLWWMCLEIVGPARNRLWWVVFIMTGAWLGAGVSWRY